MAEREIEIDIEGLHKILHMIDRVDEERGNLARQLVDRLGSYALYWLRIYAPTGESLGLIRRMTRTAPRWRPGGAGGGGEWEVIAGVETGPGGRYPLYVSGGTGLYRPLNPGLIYARRGKPMSFQKEGEPRKFRRWIRGQRSQPFLYLSWQQVLLYSGAQIQLMGREILPDA